MQIYGQVDIGITLILKLLSIPIPDGIFKALILSNFIQITIFNLVNKTIPQI